MGSPPVPGLGLASTVSALVMMMVMPLPVSSIFPPPLPLPVTPLLTPTPQPSHPLEDPAPNLNLGHGFGFASHHPSSSPTMSIRSSAPSSLDAPPPSSSSPSDPFAPTLSYPSSFYSSSPSLTPLSHSASSHSWDPTVVSPLPIPFPDGSMKTSQFGLKAEKSKESSSPLPFASHFSTFISPSSIPLIPWWGSSAWNRSLSPALVDPSEDELELMHQLNFLSLDLFSDDLSLPPITGQFLIPLSSPTLTSLYPKLSPTNPNPLSSLPDSISSMSPPVSSSGPSSPVSSSASPSSSADSSSSSSSLPSPPSAGSLLSISGQIAALRNMFQSLMDTEREIVWKPMVPSRSSRSFFLVKLFSNLLRIMPFNEFLEQIRDGVSTRASCLTCNILANVFTSRMFPMDILSLATRTVCSMFRLQSPRVCNGLINSFRSTFEYVRLQSNLTSSEMCAIVMGQRCAAEDSIRLKWTIDIPKSPTSPSVSPSFSPSFSPSLAPSLSSSPSSSPSRPSLPPSTTTTTTTTSTTTSAPTSFLDLVIGTVLDTVMDPFLQPSNKHLLQSKHSIPSMDPDPDRNNDQDPEPTAPLDLIEPNSQLEPKMEGKSNTLFYQNQDNKDDVPYLSSSPPSSRTFTMVHITDLHFDPYYVPGSRVECGEPVCCRVSHGVADSFSKMAGIWGDYRECDTPYFTMEQALSRVAAGHPDAKYWVMGGDLPPHDIWEYSRNETQMHIRFTSWLIRQFSKDKMVLPVVGNHEGVPINSFAPPGIDDPEHNPSWLYDYAADQWTGWLNPSALNAFRRGGQYVVKMFPGFRILSLNSNYCARLNPWSLHDPVDPGHQLKWLVDQLKMAETAGDRVHIIGHVPPDHRECTEAWIFNYLRVVQRFNQTIRSQFYGHTHRDEFRVLYSMSENEPDRKLPSLAPDSGYVDEFISPLDRLFRSRTEGDPASQNITPAAVPPAPPIGPFSHLMGPSATPMGFQFITPSVTSYSQTNPSYRVYTIDSRTLDVVDYETFFFNLTAANERKENYRPVWYSEYDAKELHGNEPISAVTFDRILRQVMTSDEALDSFLKRYYVQSPQSEAIDEDTVRHRIVNEHTVSNPFTRHPENLIPVH